MRRSLAQFKRRLTRRHRERNVRDPQRPHQRPHFHPAVRHQVFHLRQHPPLPLVVAGNEPILPVRPPRFPLRSFNSLVSTRQGDRTVTVGPYPTARMIGRFDRISLLAVSLAWGKWAHAAFGSVWIISPEIPGGRANNLPTICHGSSGKVTQRVSPDTVEGTVSAPLASVIAHL